MSEDIPEHIWFRWYEISDTMWMMKCVAHDWDHQGEASTETAMQFELWEE